MRNRLAKVALLGVLVAIPLQATEFRSPLLSERGPIRYKLEKGNPDRYSLDIYSLAYRREAHKAFMSHSMDTQPLTALFFNKADIPLNEIFPVDSTGVGTNGMNPLGKYYNPFVDLATIKPRATYYEWGVNLGARFEYPVCKDAGRVGLRLNVPFRLIEIERENILKEENEWILTRQVQIETLGNGPAVACGKENKVVKIYNLALLRRLFDDPARTERGLEVNTGLENQVWVFAQDLSQDWFLNNAGLGFTTGQIDTNNPGAPLIAGVIYNETGKSSPKEPTLIGNSRDANDPYPTNPMHWAFNAKILNIQVDAIDAPQAAYRLIQAQRQAIAIQNSGNAADVTNSLDYVKEIAFFTYRENDGATARDYSSLVTDDTQLKKMWLVLARDANANLVAGADIIADRVEELKNQYPEDPYEWMLNKHNFEFATYRRTGFGDIDLDLFYEYMLNHDAFCEVMVGVRFPTGADDDYSQNPYKAHLGNGEHWEVKLGGMLAWQPIKWMNIKLDAYYSFVIEATEKRCAAFKGAKIKNIGPAVDADVEWQYLVSRLDCTFFHPKTNNISATLGYEFYYKGEDDVTFKDTQATTWAGVHFNDSTNELKADLDNKLAESNTERFGHKVRFEGRYQLAPRLEVFLGGAYTFAGKNLPRETDAHGGFNVRF